MITIVFTSLMLKIYLNLILALSHIGSAFQYIQLSDIRHQRILDELSCDEFKKLAEIRDAHAENIICP